MLTNDFTKFRILADNIGDCDNCPNRGKNCSFPDCLELTRRYAFELQAHIEQQDQVIKSYEQLINKAHEENARLRVQNDVLWQYIVKHNG